MGREYKISFGKVKYYSKRRVHEIEINISTKSWYLGISGGLWNGSHTDYEMCGQCLDELRELVEEKKDIFDTIYDIWKKWHLKPVDKVPAEVFKKLEAICGGSLS